jgi:putative serine protease PepD
VPIETGVRAEHADAGLASTSPVADGVGSDGAASSPVRPLILPGPGVRLLAIVVLAVLIGALGGGAAAWAIYQHYGPVERIVTQQINGSPSSQTETVGQLAEAKAGSVVTIATQPVTPSDVVEGSASLVDGVVVGSDGLILTSAHAVEGASQLRVGLPDGHGYDAEIAGVDAVHGLAVLRISGVTDLAAIALASAAPAIGDQAIALSRPASGGLSVGVGTVSAVGLTVTTDSTTGGSVQDAISIDSTSEPDADGAPVLNSAGDLIGIVVTITQASSPLGLTALSLSAASTLIASVSGGTVQSEGSFGATATYLDPARAAAADLVPGALIESVDVGGPAGTAGLQEGDIVTGVNGISIDATHPFDAAGLDLSPGDTAEVTVVNGTATRTLAITVGTAS